MRINLTFFALITAMLQLSFATNAQDITFSKKGASLEEIFEAINKQTSYQFLYTGEMMKEAKTVNMQFYKTSLKKVLEYCFKDQPLSYSINKNTIIVRRKANKSSILAPPAEIKGRVTDTIGRPLSNVSLTLKGTSIVTKTDDDGRFSIVSPDTDAIIIFTSVGFITQEISIKEAEFVNLVLKESISELTEVVVVGYGTQLKTKLTTSISHISGSDINQLPVSTPGEALTGLAAGVQVQSARGGYPGEAPIIRIRGAGSLGAGNDPLYVVDGYPLQNANQFARMNVADIESIDILKDAASAAIYGSRAANGVVIVTTKRGKAGKPSFGINAFTGLQQVSKKIDLMNKAEYLAVSKQASVVRGEQYPDIFDHPDELPDTDWQDVIFDTAPISEIHLSANGGSEDTKYSVSSGYVDQKGTLIGSSYKLLTFRSNLDANLNKNLKVGVNFAPSYTQQNIRTAGGTYNGSDDGGFGIDLPSPIYTALLMPPIIPVRYENGDYGQPNASPSTTQYGYLNGIANLYNPLAALELVKNRANNYRVLNSAFLEWEPITALKLKSQGGVSLEMISRELYVPSTLSYNSSPTARVSIPSLNGIASSTENNHTTDWLLENTLTYEKTFTDHHISGLILFSLQKFSAKNTLITGKPGTYTTDLVENPTASQDRSGDLSYGANSFLSSAARVTYDYKNTYLFSAALRRDGSSRFGSNNRFGTFPSLSIGWRIGNEPFIRQLKLFSELKVRASYGETGNANIGDFTWLGGIIPVNYSYADRRIFGTVQNGFSNQNLTWEKNKQKDLGLELGFLNNRFYLNLDYYEKITESMLFSKQLLGIVGYANTFQTNVGKLRNKGWEIALTTNNLRNGNLKWTTDFNFALNRSRVLDLDGPQSLPTNSAISGWSNAFKIEINQPLGNMYGFIIDGVFKNQSELDAGPKWSGGSQIGDYKARDINGDNIINEEDRTLLGNGLPDYTYGLNNRLNYKNFDLSVIIQGVQGNSIINGNARHGEAPFGKFNSVKGVYNNFFNPLEPDRDVKYNRSNASGFVLSGQLTSYAVYDGSFLRVRNITFGYTIPTPNIKIGLKSARLYVSGQNLLTLTKYPGFNPEPSLNGDTVYQPGIDQGTYPANRTFIAGINIGF